MMKKQWMAGLAAAAVMLGSMAMGGYAFAEEAVTDDTVAAEEAAADDTAVTDDAAEDTTESTEEEWVRSYLTGKLVPSTIGRTIPIAIMINNIENALPQSGISNAAIVYEAPVEGGITRLLAIMEDYQDVERIGSVRSCREYFVYFAREFEAIYMHYGHAVFATPVLNLEDTIRLSGMADYDLNYEGEGDVVYYRSDDFESPHNVFTNYELIQAGIEYKGISTDYSDEYIENNGHYQFAGDDEVITLDDGVDALTVEPGYVYNYPEFVYDEETGLYTRYQLGALQTDYLTGKGLTYDNILIQYCSYEDLGEGYLDIDVYSGGEGVYITRGKAIPITWAKDDPDLENELGDGNFGVTHYYDTDGEEITLNQGKTWVCIVLDSSMDDVMIGEITGEDLAAMAVSTESADTGTVSEETVSEETTAE
ncbi:MAG: DUF3048 domain-containing protein [Lachnospiraceae bacterium]|nr:DUF3048 domain-containing protein [Lachnospiraceae bacterium]